MNEIRVITREDLPIALDEINEKHWLQLGIKVIGEMPNGDIIADCNAPGPGWVAGMGIRRYLDLPIWVARHINRRHRWVGEHLTKR